ncbi:MAG: hypothetical protein D6681_09700 [Calditrichaeota bacterium]|nr:MAG: hypothetical protein D6681_09700 [Calditrichota bacterium]
MNDRLTVAIQGERASYHDLAARSYFHRPVQVQECRTFRQVCAAVLEGRADLGVMAIENSLAGSLLPNYSLLESHPLFIEGEIYLPIHQCLMALPGQTLADIHTVRSHPMALHQCSEFLERHPALRAMEAFDTAGSAREIREQGLRGVAAIAAGEAARRYQLTILARGIENQRENYTRFLVIGGRPPQPTPAADKASLSFRVAHRPGALVEVLEIFRRHRINLTLIQSVPIPGRPTEYAFHVDITWAAPEAFQEAIHTVRELAAGFKLLGIYKAGELPHDHPRG